MSDKKPKPIEEIEHLMKKHGAENVRLSPSGQVEIGPFDDRPTIEELRDRLDREKPEPSAEREIEQAFHEAGEAMKGESIPATIGKVQDRPEFSIEPESAEPSADEDVIREFLGHCMDRAEPLGALDRLAARLKQLKMAATDQVIEIDEDGRVHIPESADEDVAMLHKVLNAAAAAEIYDTDCAWAQLDHLEARLKGSVESIFRLSARLKEAEAERDQARQARDIWKGFKEEAEAEVGRLKERMRTIIPAYEKEQESLRQEREEMCLQRNEWKQRAEIFDSAATKALNERDEAERKGKIDGMVLGADRLADGSRLAQSEAVRDALRGHAFGILAEAAKLREGE